MKELYTIPFTSKRKYSLTVISQENTEKVRVYIKGTTEVILENCTDWIFSEKILRKLTGDERVDIIDNVISDLNKKGLKTITLAFKDIPAEDFIAKQEIAEMEKQLLPNLTMIAILGIVDPLRPEIPEAIKKCKRGGITIRMISGENLETTRAIGEECGVLEKQDLSFENKYSYMDGKGFREEIGGITSGFDGKGLRIPKIKNQQAFDRILIELRALAKADSYDKFLLSTGLRHKENVVLAATAHETTDKDYLKKVHVGFGLAKCGTEVAKQDSDILLLDDNFNGVVKAIKWSRNIFESVRKFIQFQFSSALVGIFIVFVGALINGESPINPVQLLWVTLLMDTFASLALATEPPREVILKPFFNIFSPF